MDRVAFITIESGTDLIVAFAIKGDEPVEVKSLILLRTPKYEFALDGWERGVSVSHDDFLDEDLDLLKSIELDRSTVRITTQRREYALDIQSVDRDKIQRAAEILEEMNFDKCFL
jgi:hypothetical protein